MISRLLAVNGTKLISPKTYSAANGITNNPPNWFAARTSFTLAETMTFSSTLKRHARGAPEAGKPQHSNSDRKGSLVVDG
jgi:hypothetical protein